MKHYLTIDVEDWFQVYFAEKLIDRHSWSTQPSKIGAMLETLLDLLDVNQARGTFFFVGWIAKHHPTLIRLVNDRGHEIASHGFWHQEYYDKSADILRSDIQDSKAALENAIGRPVPGFRAPGFSIQRDHHAAIDLIQEAGHAYDSSVFSEADAPYAIRPGLTEIPPNSLHGLGRHYPSGGGFFFRLLPYWIYRPYIRYLEAKGKRLNFYTHTWEIVHDYPRLELGFPKSFIQYARLASVKPKVSHLLSEFQFAPIRDILKTPSSYQTS